MLPHLKAWIKQTHIQGRGKFSPNSWASAKLLQWFFNTQTPLSDTDGDTQHLTHLIPTEQTQDLKLTPSGPILGGMLLVMSHSNEPWWGTCTAPSTHTQVQAELQTCTRLQKFPKPATVPLFTTEFPQLMLPWCIHITFAAGRLKAPWAGSISHSLYKKSPNWESPENWAGASNSFLLVLRASLSFPC